jgi:hypothetical protein
MAGMTIFLAVCTYKHLISWTPELQMPPQGSVMLVLNYGHFYFSHPATPDLLQADLGVKLVELEEANHG